MHIAASSILGCPILFSKNCELLYVSCKSSWTVTDVIFIFTLVFILDRYGECGNIQVYATEKLLIYSGK